MKNFRFRSLVSMVAAGLLLGCLVGLLFLSIKRREQSAPAASIPSLPQPASKPLVAKTEAEQPAPAPAPEPAPPSPEIVAEAMKPTREMYLAHAPLRLPEVADPDSATNREVLQTMVLKAFDRATSASK